MPSSDTLPATAAVLERVPRLGEQPLVELAARLAEAGEKHREQLARAGGDAREKAMTVVIFVVDGQLCVATPIPHVVDYQPPHCEWLQRRLRAEFVVVHKVCRPPFGEQQQRQAVPKMVLARAMELIAAHFSASAAIRTETLRTEDEANINHRPFSLYRSLLIAAAGKPE